MDVDSRAQAMLCEGAGVCWPGARYRIGASDGVSFLLCWHSDEAELWADKPSPHTYRKPILRLFQGEDWNQNCAMKRDSYSGDGENSLLLFLIYRNSSSGVRGAHERRIRQGPKELPHPN